jgi:hypothetical protein
LSRWLLISGVAPKAQPLGAAILVVAPDGGLIRGDDLFDQIALGRMTLTPWQSASNGPGRRGLILRKKLTSNDVFARKQSGQRRFRPRALNSDERGVMVRVTSRDPSPPLAAQDDAFQF